MNREIIFKAKRVDNGRWVVGGYFSEPYTDKKYIVRWNSFGIGFNEFIEVNPDTLCQYTGLTDKNGQKIWENDICKMVYNGVVYVYVVVWDKTELDFKGTNGKENYGRNFEYLGCCEEIEVIGNIFDNPELLEVE